MTGTQHTDFNPIRRFEWNGLAYLLGKHWFNLFLIGLGLHLFLHKDISFQVNINAKEGIPLEENILRDGQKKGATNTSMMQAMPTSYKITQPAAQKKRNKKKPSDNRAQTFGNLTFILSPTYARRHQIDERLVQQKIRYCQEYVDRFAEVAQAEQRKYGIPAAITLAQGLLESNVGDSRLSKESNNHFGIKCKRKCKGCTCRNYTDDDIYDMFRVFDTAWESYREHSLLLNGARYKHLLKLHPDDYKGWAKGLRKAGYATDKRYAEKLIKIIEVMNLTQYNV